MQNKELFLIFNIIKRNKINYDKTNKQKNIARHKMEPEVTRRPTSASSYIAALDNGNNFRQSCTNTRVRQRRNSQESEAHWQ